MQPASRRLLSYQETAIDIRRALTFISGDPHWVRELAVAMVLNVPVVALTAVGFLEALELLSTPLYDLIAGTAWWPLVSGLVAVPLSGFSLRIMRNVIAGRDVPLPTWAKTGGILRDGLMFWGVTTLWNAPVTILDSLEGWFAPMAETLSRLSLVLTLLVMLVLPAAQARLAASGTLLAGLDVPAVIRVLRANAGGYVQLLLLTMVGAAVAAVPFMVVVGILTATMTDPGRRLAMAVSLGLVLAMLCVFPYLMFVFSHLAGQVYLRAVSRLPDAEHATAAA